MAQYTMTERIDLPSCMRSKAVLISSSGMVWVIRSSMLILPSMYQSTIFGTSVRPARAAEGGALPDAAGDELERAGGDLLAGLGDADDDALAPAAMAAFERLAHHVGVAGGVEREIRAAAGEVDDRLHRPCRCRPRRGLMKSVMPNLLAISALRAG